MVEIDLGNAPTALDGSDSVWGDLELAAVTGSAHQFRRLDPALNPTSACRIRFRGAFEQRGAWTAAYFAYVGQPRLSMLPDPLNVGANETSNLFVWIANATSATLTEVGGTLSQAVTLNAMGNFFGSLVVSPGGSGSIYRVVATNAVGDSMEEHLVSVFQRQGGSVTPPSGVPRIDTFFADDVDIRSNENATLRWMTSGSLSVAIDQGVGGVDPDGSRVVSPSSSRTYTLTVGEGTEAVTASVRIFVGRAGFLPPVIGFFRSSPTVIQSGSSSTLSWQIATGGRATTISIDQGVGAVTFDADGRGSVSVSPTVTTEYRMTVTNSEGSPTADATVTVGADVDPPVIDTFTADPTAITEGESVSLAWTTTNATSVQLADNPATLALDGSLTVTPTETTIYTLEATNDNSSVTSTLTVTVGDVPTGPRIDSFSVDDPIILTGESTTLRWTTSNTTDVSLSGFGDVANDGSVLINPTITTLYVLTAGTGADAVLLTITVTVTSVPLPVIASFQSEPAYILIGESSNLEWDVSGADSLSINQGVGAVTPVSTGSVTVSPTAADTTYILTATNTGGSVTLATRVVATAEPLVPPTIDTYSISPNPIQVGQSAVIAWATTDAVTVRFSGVPFLTFPLDGSRTVTPASTTDYRLTASNDDGSVAQTITLAVNAASPILYYQSGVPTQFSPNAPEGSVYVRSDGADGSNNWYCRTNASWVFQGNLNGAPPYNPLTTGNGAPTVDPPDTTISARYVRLGTGSTRGNLHAWDIPTQAWVFAFNLFDRC